jgi:hypothetical protein
MGVCVVVVFFAGVTLAFAWLGGGPDIPHAVDGARAACTACHPAGSLPDGHRDLRGDSCRSCHSERSSDAGAPVGGSDDVEVVGHGSSGGTLTRNA